MFIRKRFAMLALAVLIMFVVSACALHRHHYEGALAGMGIGAVAGALLDDENRWRGGVIGAAIGAIAGATLTDIAVRGSREAAMSGRSVEYRTEDGRGIYHAQPRGEFFHPDPHTKCRMVHERVWEDGVLVKDVIREVCMPM
ncbi:YMGG-like glycine zipper-containing protein [Thermodesulfovibrionales bacterium]|nr:YMGG-like glycine zipper-containing protein [Thermodesulfovibrionales bacterium]MCL0047022.1 YMGG-like glycine zipper-containing protein [Thermodesulfovibrionales bacterium]MCL0066771.1 YMGG-like glycine zipper-containing protein [Thermodesulfovibrionales bacterium]